MLLLSIWNTYLGNDLWKADVCTMLCCKYWNSLLFTGPTQVSEKSWLLSGLREDRCRTNFLRVTNFALKLMDIMLKSGIWNEYWVYVCYLSLPADDCQSALRMLPLGRLVSGSASAVAEFFRSLCFPNLLWRMTNETVQFKNTCCVDKLSSRWAQPSHGKTDRYNKVEVFWVESHQKSGHKYIHSTSEFWFFYVMIK